MPEPMTKLADAFAYTARIHATQVRKGTTIPYLSHLMSVSALVLEHGGDEELAIAGLLHDAIEDVGAEQEPIILERYGARVAHIVRACTDADTLPKPPWRARKEAYLAHLETADPDVLLVSCADKLHNARAILSDLRTDGPAVFNRFTAGQDGTLWYYKALAEVFLQRLANSIAQRLRETVSALVAETIAAAVTQ
jgi:(p)ppGpp synthase/HD superfamily hydrolase